MSNKNNNYVGVNKFSFYTLLSMAILYMTSIVLSVLKIGLAIIGYLQGLATAVALCIVAGVAWKYVACKTSMWKVLYFLVLLIVLVGIVIPLI